MKPENIDKLFREQQHQFDKMPSGTLWERLEEKLHPVAEHTRKVADKTTEESGKEKEGIRQLAWWKYASVAAMLILIPLSVWWLGQNMSVHKDESGLAMEKVAAPASADVEKNRNVSRSESENLAFSSDANYREENTSEQEDAIVLAKENDKQVKALTDKVSRLEKEVESVKKDITTNVVIPLESDEKPAKDYVYTDKDERTTESPLETSIGDTKASKPASIATGGTAGKQSAVTTYERKSPDNENTIYQGGGIADEQPDRMESQPSKPSPSPVTYGYSSPTQPSAMSQSGTLTKKELIASADHDPAYSRYYMQNRIDMASNIASYEVIEEIEWEEESLDRIAAKKTAKSMSKKNAKSKGGMKSKKMAEGTVEDDFIMGGDIEQARDSEDSEDDIDIAFTYALLKNSLTGEWMGLQFDLLLSEDWTTSGNTLEGRSYTSQNGKALFEEDFKIVKKGLQILYLIKDAKTGQNKTYVLSSQTANTFTFSNHEEDYPQKIIYAKQSDNTWYVSFKGKQKGEPFNVSYVLIRKE